MKRQLSYYRIWNQSLIWRCRTGVHCPGYHNENFSCVKTDLLLHVSSGIGCQTQQNLLDFGFRNAHIMIYALLLSSNMFTFEDLESISSELSSIPSSSSSSSSSSSFSSSDESEESSSFLLLPVCERKVHIFKECCVVHKLQIQLPNTTQHNRTVLIN